MRCVDLVLVIALWEAVLQFTNPNTARADPPSAGTCEMTSRLIAFVSERTAYKTVQKCPRILRVTSTELRSLVARKTQSHSGDPLAIYLPSSDDIMLSQEIDLSSPLGRSYLVHELVHAQQIAVGVHSRAPCIGWLEGEAYRIQSEYLRQQGAAKDAFQIEILGLLQGACANAYHPDLILR